MLVIGRSLLHHCLSISADLEEATDISEHVKVVRQSLWVQIHQKIIGRLCVQHVRTLGETQ